MAPVVAFPEMAAPRHFRAFARRVINLPVTIATQAQGPRPARLVNLGLGGACIEVPAAPSFGAGHLVTLEVTAPNLWDPLVVPATVAWVRLAPAGNQIAGLAFNHATKGVAALPALVELLLAFRYE